MPNAPVAMFVLLNGVPTVEVKKNLCIALNSRRRTTAVLQAMSGKISPPGYLYDNSGTHVSARSRNRPSTGSRRSTECTSPAMTVIGIRPPLTRSSSTPSWAAPRCRRPEFWRLPSPVGPYRWRKASITRRKSLPSCEIWVSFRFLQKRQPGSTAGTS